MCMDAAQRLPGQRRHGCEEEWSWVFARAVEQANAAPWSRRSADARRKGDGAAVTGHSEGTRGTNSGVVEIGEEEDVSS